MPGTTLNPYDEVPYPVQPVTHSHPDRIAAVARLFGMNPPAPERCRVLELGCALGSNLLPMADQLPEAKFLGIDYSLRQITAGQKGIALLGLKNVELRHQSILDVDESIGQFDYIIAHGVFSWVAPEIQDKMLALCRSCLSPQGVAFISYNIKPGWHLRGVVRKMLLNCASSAEPSLYRAAKCRKLLQFMATALAEDTSDYGRTLKIEVDTLIKHSDSYLVHEYLAEQNRPMYFHEFTDWAAKHQLQYLADAQPSTMFTINFGSIVEQNLLSMSDDLLAVEQYMDLLRNRSFRQTLLCHEDAPLTRRISAASFENIFVAGDLRPDQPTIDFTSGIESRFVSAQGVATTASVPAIKAAIVHLGQSWPRSLSLDELLNGAAARLVAAGMPAVMSPADRAILGEYLAHCLAGGLIEVFGRRDTFVTRPGARPVAGVLARQEAASGSQVTSRRHQMVNLDETALHVLRHLDGQHDRESLLRILVEATDRGQLSILRNGIPAGSGLSVLPILEQALDRSLTTLATQAMLAS